MTRESGSHLILHFLSSFTLLLRSISASDGYALKCILKLRMVYIKFLTKSMIQILTLSQIEDRDSESIPTLFLNTKLHELSFEEFDYFLYLDAENDILNSYPDFVNIKGSKAKRRVDADVDEDVRPSAVQARVVALLFGN